MQPIRASGNERAPAVLMTSCRIRTPHQPNLVAAHLTTTISWASRSTTPGWQAAGRRRLRPRLTWWANVVSDAGHHGGGGPRSDIAIASLKQSDARLVVFLDHLRA